MVKPIIIIRAARESDIARIVDIEMHHYGDFHSELGNTREDLAARFQKRLKNLQDWYMVAEADGQVVGSLSAMPTHKGPDDFVSWEESTDDGLCSSYTPGESYEYLYIVNLDVDPAYTIHDAQYKLMSAVGVKGVKARYYVLYFESRMPGFRSWVESESGFEWGEASEQERYKLADSYSRLRRPDGLKVDRLLRFYQKNGLRMDRVVPNAFRDPESLDYGAVFIIKSPIRPKSRIGSSILSYLAGRIVKHPRIAEKVF